MRLVEVYQIRCVSDVLIDQQAGSSCSSIDSVTGRLGLLSACLSSPYISYANPELTNRVICNKDSRSKELERASQLAKQSRSLQK